MERTEKGMSLSYILVQMPFWVTSNRRREGPSNNRWGKNPEDRRTDTCNSTRRLQDQSILCFFFWQWQVFRDVGHNVQQLSRVIYSKYTIRLLRVAANSANVHILSAAQKVSLFTVATAWSFGWIPSHCLQSHVHANTGQAGICINWFTVLFPEGSKPRPSAQGHAEHKTWLPSNQKHMAQACNCPMNWTSKGAEYQG